MEISMGPFLTCFLTILVLTGYLYIVLYKSRTIFKCRVKIIFAVMAVIMIRMLIPVNFPFTYTVYSYHILIGLGDIINAHIEIGGKQIFIFDVFVILWASGAAIQLVRYIRKRRMVRKYLEYYLVTDKEKRAYYDSFLRAAGIKNMRIAVLPGENGAAIFGLIRPIMILPDYMLEDQDMSYIIQHEIEHYHHYDLWLKWIVDLLAAIHWWNPLVYLMRRELNNVLELSNDYVVTKEMTEREKLDYAQTLLKIAKLKQKRNRYALNLADGGCLEIRIHLLMEPKEPKTRKQRLTILGHMIFIGLVMLVSVIVVPEVSYREEIKLRNEEEGSFEMTPENAYFIKTEEGYEIYADGIYRGIMEEVDETFKEMGIPVYEEKGEQEQ